MNDIIGTTGYYNTNPIVNGGVGYGPTPPPAFRYNGGSVQETAQYNGLGIRTVPYSFTTPQIGQVANAQYTYNFPSFGYTPTPEQIKQQKNVYYHKAYNDGLISLSDYCYYGNCGYDVHPQQQTISPFGQNSWYSQGMSSLYQRQAMQRKMQEEYEQQLDIHKLLCKAAATGRGGNYDPNTLDLEIQRKQQWEKYYYDKAVLEKQRNDFAQFVYSLPNSSQKGYVSPIRAIMTAGWNKFYEERNGKYPENYGIDEFFNKGIFARQILDEYDRIAKDEEKHLDRLYDKQEFRNYMHEMHPEYDPIAGASAKGWKLGIDDLSISVPPELAKQEYAQRREKFMNTIFADNRLNFNLPPRIPQAPVM